MAPWLFTGYNQSCRELKGIGSPKGMYVEQAGSPLLDEGSWFHLNPTLLENITLNCPKKSSPFPVLQQSLSQGHPSLLDLLNTTGKVFFK